MSHCLMYRQGDTAIIRGVPCDFVRVRLGEREKYKALGYVGTLAELQPEELTLLEQFQHDACRMSKDQLIELAEQYGLKINKRTKHQNMVKAINEVL